jgi:hypothetical protein
MVTLKVTSCRFMSKKEKVRKVNKWLHVGAPQKIHEKHFQQKFAIGSYGAGI